MQGLLAATQNGGIAAFQTQARCIGRDVRARLIDDADHAKRHAHMADLDAGRAPFDVGDFASRIGQRGDLFEALGHAFDALGAKCQPIDHRGVEAVVARLGEIAFIGREQFRLVGANFRSHGVECRIFRVGRGGCDQTRSCARLFADLFHVLLDVHGAFVLPYSIFN